MPRFTYIEHTGDLGIRVYGQDLSMLFRHAAEAFFEIITDPGSIRLEDTQDITLRANGLEELMVAWLNEFLFLFDAKGRLFREFEINVPNNRELKAMARGEVFSEGRHPIKTLIKAVTYHQLQVIKKEGLWRARIIFDL
jgi:SHS2 domain-containing protein